MKWAGVVIVWCVVAFGSAARAQDKTSEFLSQLERVNKEYYEAHMYPPAAGSFTAFFDRQWEAKENKRKGVRDALAAFSGKAIDAVLLQRVQDGVKYTDALFESATVVLPRLKTEVQRSRIEAIGAWSYTDPAQFVFAFQSYVVATFLAQKEMAKHRECEREEQEFSSNWDAYIQRLAKINPAYEKFAKRPDSSNPLTGLTIPPKRFPVGKGTTFDDPHQVGIVRHAIEEHVEKTPDSWRHVYLARVDQPQRLTAQVDPSNGLVGLRIHQFLGAKKLCCLRHTMGRPGQPVRLEIEAKEGVDYAIEVFHIRRDGLDPLWSGTDANVRIWLGDDLPDNYVNLEKHKTLAKEEVAGAVGTIEDALVRDILYAGTSKEPRGTVRFFATYTFDAKTQRISGMHEYPDLDSVNRVEGSITKKKTGEVEVQLKETEVVRKGRAAAGGQYVLRAELREGKLVLSGSSSGDRMKSEIAIEEADGAESLQRNAEARFRRPGADTSLSGEVILSKGGKEKVRFRMEPGRNGVLSGSVNCGAKKITLEFGGTITTTPLGFFFEATETPKKTDKKDPKKPRTPTRLSRFKGNAKWLDANRVLEVEVLGGDLNGTLRLDMRPDK